MSKDNKKKWKSKVNKMENHKVECNNKKTSLDSKKYEDRWRIKIK